MEIESLPSLFVFVVMLLASCVFIAGVIKIFVADAKKVLKARNSRNSSKDGPDPDDDPTTPHSSSTGNLAAALAPPAASEHSGEETLRALDAALRLEQEPVKPETIRPNQSPSF